jgi:hypothetical protein
MLRPSLHLSVTSAVMEKNPKSQKLQTLPERNQLLATAHLGEKGFFLMSCVSAVEKLETRNAKVFLREHQAHR